MVGLHGVEHQHSCTTCCCSDRRSHLPVHGPRLQNKYALRVLGTTPHSNVSAPAPFPFSTRRADPRPLVPPPAPPRPKVCTDREASMRAEVEDLRARHAELKGRFDALWAAYRE